MLALYIIIIITICRNSQWCPPGVTSPWVTITYQSIYRNPFMWTPGWTAVEGARLRMRVRRQWFHLGTGKWPRRSCQEPMVLAAIPPIESKCSCFQNKAKHPSCTTNITSKLNIDVKFSVVTYHTKILYDLHHVWFLKSLYMMTWLDFVIPWTTPLDCFFKLSFCRLHQCCVDYGENEELKKWSESSCFGKLWEKYTGL